MGQSIIGWQGGKLKTARKIISMIPLDIKCYAEAMVGSGAVLFAKPITPNEHINDKDDNIITFWKCVKNRRQELIDSFKYVPVSRTIFYDYRDKYLRNDFKDDIEKAHVFYYLCKVSFGSRMLNPTYGGLSPERASSFNHNTLNRLFDRAWERLKNVSIDNLDYQDFIASRDRETTFFFFDPPYHELAQYNITSWCNEDYEQLCDSCHEMQGRFLLTINGTSFIRSLFDGFYIHEYDVVYTLTKDDNEQVVKELIITNYPVHERAITATSIEIRSKRLKKAQEEISVFDFLH